jgi:coenzyme F420 hydrogenase subunit beta
MGEVKRVFIARATDPEIKRKAQTGGVVSALISFALEKGMIDAALLTRRDDDQMPEGFVARSREEVLACAGSSYVAAGTLEALNREPWKDNERVAIVGLPCQVLASAKMRPLFKEKRDLGRRVNLVVGLFCTWALVYGAFIRFVQERVKGSPILGMDISPPPEPFLRVRTSNTTWEIPLEQIREFIQPGCSVCLDLTSELADVSVGTVEGKEGWNTVIVRTEQGKELLRVAEREGIIETLPLPDVNLQHLKQASLLKKRRGLLALKERGELERGCIVFPPQWIEKILSDSVEGLSP